MKEPWFWRANTPAARLVALSLAPAGALYDAGRRLARAATRTERPPVPVICVGNATLGGVGKTSFALMLAPLLAAKGFHPAFLSRGYGGRFPGPLRVDPSVHTASDVGDEPLLLAEVALTFVSRNRIAGARAAAESGADLVIMDDGHQNASIEKAFSILLVAEDGNARNRVFPAGPLREPMREAAARADAIVYVANEPAVGVRRPESSRPSFRAWLEAERQEPARVVAFCGIGRPERFFSSLTRSGFEIASQHSFPDHHPFADDDIADLRRLASAEGAALITTRKDFVRIPLGQRDGVRVLDVAMRIDDPERLAELVAGAARAQALKAGR